MNFINKKKINKKKIIMGNAQPNYKPSKAIPVKTLPTVQNHFTLTSERLAWSCDRLKNNPDDAHQLFESAYKNDCFDKIYSGETVVKIDKGLLSKLCASPNWMDDNKNQMK